MIPGAFSDIFPEHSTHRGDEKETGARGEDRGDRREEGGERSEERGGRREKRRGEREREREKERERERQRHDTRGRARERKRERERKRGEESERERERKRERERERQRHDTCMHIHLPGFFFWISSSAHIPQAGTATQKCRQPKPVKCMHTSAQPTCPMRAEPLNSRLSSSRLSGRSFLWHPEAS